MSGALSETLKAVRENRYAQAEATLTAFLNAKFPALTLAPSSLAIRQDNISLNSVNGTFADSAGKKYFFKFHLEEDEASTLEEYYKAELLANAGYPTELPVLISKEVGEQILIYPYVEYERMFDVCARNESGMGAQAQEVIKAQAGLDRLNAEKCIQTLSVGMGEDYRAEALLQLFFWRLVDKQSDGTYTRNGGRHRSFYIGQNFTFSGGLTLGYEDLARLKWNINDVAYDMTLAQAFGRAYESLSPDTVDLYPACIAHGDAHNGNVWVKQNGDGMALSYFDPAFAGEKIPVLLAEVKATFHNIFAHPLWLYNAREADQNLSVTAEVKGDTLYVRHNWELSPLRVAFLRSKQDLFWIPVLKKIKANGLLPGDWENFIRAALFCCPTLVMNLRANAGTAQNSHTPQTSLLGLSIAMLCACAPANGTDPVDQLFKSIKNALQE